MRGLRAFDDRPVYLNLSFYLAEVFAKMLESVPGWWNW